jgi:cell division protease FtsH
MADSAAVDVLGRRGGPRHADSLTTCRVTSAPVDAQGHAVLACVLEHADPVHKVTILPAGHALGTTQQMPAVDRHLHEGQQLLDTLALQLGGPGR